MTTNTPRLGTAAQTAPHDAGQFIDKWENPSHNPIMATTVTLDSAGRVLIPRALRDELQLQPGDTLALDSNGEHVTLKPVRSESAMRKEHGVWVFRSGAKIAAADTDEALAKLRTQRHSSRGQ